MRTPCTALAVATLIGGCGGPDDSTFAERQELANTRPSMVVPKSSGRGLTQAFEQFCLDPGLGAERRSTRLRGAGYVPNGGWQGPHRQFVTDDTRPMVIITQHDRACGVRARSRTGQQAAVVAAMKRWFPKARLESDSGGRQIWSTGRTATEAVFVVRDPRGPESNEVTLAVMKGTGDRT